MAAAMTDHIQNNPFGRSTDGHRDDWSAVQRRFLSVIHRRVSITECGYIAATSRLRIAD